MKEQVWLLFDNIDKGWSVEGISDVDIAILSCLINASRIIERDFKSRHIEFHSIVFVRDARYREWPTRSIKSDRLKLRSVH